MRYELTLRSADEVTAAVATLRRHGIVGVNVTDTAREIDPVAIARALLEAEPTLDVMVHLSAKHSAAENDVASRNAFVRRVAGCVDAGIKKALVMSGQPKQPFDALAALEALDAEGYAIEAYGVHNPFLTAGQLEEENARAERKLRNGSVRGICFQIGTDLAALAAGASYLRSLRFDVTLLASVPVPTAEMLERLKAKPLFGVSLPEAYFAAPEEAASMTRDYLAALDAYDIEPLFFGAGADDAAIELSRTLAGK